MAIQNSRNRRYLISKNLILMLVMVVLIILAVMAWFTFNKTVTATNIVVKADAADIDIADSIKTFNSSNEKVTDGPGEFGSSVTFNGPYSFSKDCTGDGANLIVPQFNVTKDFVSVKMVGKEVNENLQAANAVSDYSRALEKVTADSVNLSTLGKITNRDIKQRAGEGVSEYQYIEEDFYVRSKNKDVLLTADSQLLAQTEADGSELTNVSYTSQGVSYNKKSTYGNFNVDGLIGSIRVALIGQGTTSVSQTWQTISGTPTITQTNAVFGHDGSGNSAVKQILWLPRPDVMLNVTENSDDVTHWTLGTGLTSGPSYTNTYYEKKANEQSGVKLVTDTTGTKVSSGTKDGHKSLGENVNISNFSSYEEQSGAPVQKVSLIKDKNHLTGENITENYYVTKYTLKVWIEGTDAEARRAMDGGSFNLTLKFM